MGITMRNGTAVSAELRRLALAIRGAPKRVRADAAKRAATRLRARIDLQFQFGKDPDGRRYPLPQDGHRPAMMRSGDLRRSYSVRVAPTDTGLSLSFVSSKFYAWFLQKGTDKMSPRRQVPEGRLPNDWLGDLRTSYQEAYSAWYARLRV